MVADIASSFHSGSGTPMSRWESAGGSTSTSPTSTTSSFAISPHTGYQANGTFGSFSPASTRIDYSDSLNYSQSFMPVM